VLLENGENEQVGHSGRSGHAPEGGVGSLTPSSLSLLLPG
jgi:hypothetical protein